ncbi:hypothetical protein PVA45_06675 [Entomospira entomophila]|uniref:Uncharacterized protein n=1 Tax=Entomospira entomophila TaxID=2719988 RepID=A0A968GDT5_9SPIO|nr:hypothetical protein [Entomospira entomophilus]NIZ41184.1 hypothetical protein [Entomospira entomophilus]WDI35391.1 hypothetical protein PVA45_06675 [Entomospira entomophilus]
MNKKILGMLAMIFFTAVACVQKPQSLTQEHFSSTLTSAFERQSDVPEIVNGTLRFYASEELLIWMRNGNLVVDADATPFIAAGLEHNDEIRIGDYILFNTTANRIMIARNFAQTMDMQFIGASEIADRLYEATQREGTPYTLSYDKKFIMIDDGIIMMKWTDSATHFGIHKDVLSNAGVDISALEGFSLDGDFVIVAVQ